MTSNARKLEENAYNHGRNRDEQKFKLWTSAGLMLTYWCSSRCACCYVYSGPGAGSADNEMTVDLAVHCWRGLIDLAGERAQVHLTGGEPFVDFDRLHAILHRAQQETLTGLEKVETNAYWCSDDEIVRKRLAALQQVGLTRLQISTDVYHQEYVPLEYVRRAAAIARDILGDDGVQIRWRDYLDHPCLVDVRDPEHRAQAFRQAYALRPERMVGRAADELAPLLEQRPWREFAERTCRDSFLNARHIHIDGAGHVFSGTCAGIIVGRIATELSLDHLWVQLDYRAHPLVHLLMTGGPTELVKIAEPLGFVPRSTYVNRCHLCFDLRRFLFVQGLFRDELGPAVCYGQSEAYLRRD